MNAKQTIPTLATVAPVLAAGGAPVLIGVAIIGALVWLFSSEETKADLKALEAPPKPVPPRVPVPSASVNMLRSAQPRSRMKRVSREDLAEALEYGERPVTRQEAVAALQQLGFKKTAAYKAISPDSRFGELLEYTPDGLIEWRG